MVISSGVTVITHSLRGAKVFDKYVNYAYEQMGKLQGDDFIKKVRQEYTKEYGESSELEAQLREEVAAYYTQVVC